MRGSKGTGDGKEGLGVGGFARGRPRGDTWRWLVGWPPTATPSPLKEFLSTNHGFITFNIRIIDYY